MTTQLQIIYQQWPIVSQGGQPLHVDSWESVAPSSQCASLYVCVSQLEQLPIPWELRPGASNRALHLSVPGESTLPLSLPKDFSFTLRQEQLLLSKGPLYFLDTWEIVQIFIYLENSDLGV